MNYTLELGRSFLHEGSRITYKGRANNAGRDYLFVLDNKLQVVFTADELGKLRQDDLLPDWTGEVIADDTPPQPLSYANATESERCAADRRLEYCMEWAANPTPRSEAGLQPLIDRVHNRRKAVIPPNPLDVSPPCASSVRKWIAAWQRADRLGFILVCRERFRGNRRRRYEQVLDDVLHEFVEKHYLTNQRLPVAEVHRRVGEHIREENKTRSIHWPVPSYEAVRGVVKQLCPVASDFCRHGKNFAAEKWRAISAGYITEYPNDVWELDDTRVNLICTLEDGTVVGRPWVILVIDRHTRAIMSFVISFHPPDTSAALEAIRLAILSKDADLQRYGLTGVGYPVSGKCRIIHVDNAKHYNSKVLKRALASLGIQHATMPVLKAWYRAVVERAIGTMSRSVFHVVPGTTYASIYERDREVVPESVAYTTIDELKKSLFYWVVTEYSCKHHKVSRILIWPCGSAILRNPGSKSRCRCPSPG